MVLVEGEYEFECDECHGDGSVQAVQGVDEDSDEAELVWVKCDDCHGDGTLRVDDREAAEKIQYGQTPIRTPAAT